MKKTFLIIVACFFMGAAAGAQGLSGMLGALGSSNGGDVLGAVSNVVYAYTGKTKSVDLPGNWTYTGSAIALSGDNALTNIAGTAASTTAENKINAYLQQVGIKAGAITFTFEKDLSFVCKVHGVPISGTWKTLNDGASIQLQFGKAMKFLSMTGSLEGTMNGCRMLFEGNKFLSFIKSALAIVAKQSTAASAVNSLAGNYNNMKIGFNLKKD